MTIRAPLTLPALTPTEWELRLPDYPVINNSWRSSSFPTILGNLPTDSTWRLTFANTTSAESAEVLRLWNATGGGQWPLATLPAALAGGVDSVEFRKRLIATTWAMAKVPRVVPVKNGYFTITVELVHELTFSSAYGPGDPPPPEVLGFPLLLGLTAGLAVAALPAQRVGGRRSAGPVLGLGLPSGLAPVAPGVEARRGKPLPFLLELGLPGGLSVVALPAAREGRKRALGHSIGLGAAAGLSIAAEPVSRESRRRPLDAVFGADLLEGMSIAALGLSRSGA